MHVTFHREECAVLCNIMNERSKKESVLAIGELSRIMQVNREDRQAFQTLCAYDR